MSEYSSHLRKQAEEYRGHVDELIKRLRDRPSILRQRLISLATIEGMSQDAKDELVSLAEEFAQDPTVSIITASVGAATANIYDALADQADYLMAKGAMQTAVEKLQRNRRFHHSLRAAAAAGKWDEFNELVEDYIKGSPENEGNGSSS